MKSRNVPFVFLWELFLINLIPDCACSLSNKTSTKLSFIDSHGEGKHSVKTWPAWPERMLWVLASLLHLYKSTCPDSDLS